MAQVKDREFKEKRVGANAGSMQREADRQDASSWVGQTGGSFSPSTDPRYESRVGPGRQRVREAAHIAMPSKPMLVAIAVLMAICAVLGIVAYRVSFPSGVVISRGDGAERSSSAVDEQEDSSLSTSAEQELETQAYICVYVTGAVNSPDVYELSDGSRINDALHAAGGATTEADLTAINLAEELHDSQMVYVPRVGDQPAAADASPASSSSSSGLVNVNTAGVDELKTLNGIGDVLAQAIVDDRAANGPFASVDDLVRVSGVGSKTLAKFADKVCV
jgi:competence protein ComEA